MSTVGRSDVHTLGSKNKYKPFITEYLPLSETVRRIIDGETRNGSGGARGAIRVISLTHTHSSLTPLILPLSPSVTMYPDDLPKEGRKYARYGLRSPRFPQKAGSFSPPPG